MQVPAAYAFIILLWSTTPLAVKWSGEGVGFLFGVGVRMLLAMIVCLLVILIFRLAFPWHKKALHVYVAIGFTLYSTMMLLYWGAQYITSGLISVLFGLTPLFTGVLAAVWLSEKSFTMARSFGMLLSIVGLFVIFRQSTDIGVEALHGMFGILCAAFLHSLGTVWVKRVGDCVSAFAANTGGLMIAVTLYLVTWLLIDRSIPDRIPLHTATSIVYLSLFGSVIGAGLFYYTLKRVQANSMALLTLITPVTALLVGKWFNGETIDTNTLLGTSLILSGLIVYQWWQVFIEKLSVGVE